MMKKQSFLGFIRSHRGKFVGETVAKYRTIYVILLSLIALFEVVMLIRGIFVFDFTYYRHVSYFWSYIFLFLASIATILFLVLPKTRNKPKLLSYVVYGYVIALYCWSFLVSYMDLIGGHTPIVFLTIVVVVGGVLLLDFYFYAILTLLSYGAMLILGNIYQFKYFSTNGSVVINLLVLLAMALFMNYRVYRVSNTEADERILLDKMSRTDPLTGMNNGIAYFETIDSLNQRIHGEGFHDFAVLSLDLNGLKTTNDQYGHRYGNELLKEVANRLPKVFTSSYLYHVHGDEFAVLLFKEDYENKEAILQKLETMLPYDKILFEGEELIFSVSYGLGTYEEGDDYQSVFQKADDAMYQNKKAIKEKYGIGNRE